MQMIGLKMTGLRCGPFHLSWTTTPTHPLPSKTSLTWLGLVTVLGKKKQQKLKISEEMHPKSVRGSK